jgi:hypothetical protein
MAPGENNHHHGSPDLCPTHNRRLEKIEIQQTLLKTCGWCRTAQMAEEIFNRLVEKLASNIGTDRMWARNLENPCRKALIQTKNREICRLHVKKMLWKCPKLQNTYWKSVPAEDV